MYEQEKLPDGWILKTIGKLVNSDGIFVDGDWIESKDQDPNGGVRLIQLADIGDGYFRNRSNRFLTYEKAKELNCTFLNPGDLLIARMPDPLGRSCIFPGDEKICVTAVDVCIVRTGISGADHKWLMYAINSPQFRSMIAELQSGSTRKRISRSNLAKISFPVPPLPEQERTVERIESVLSQLDAAVAGLKRTQAALKRYKASVLMAAFEGLLVPQNLFDERAEELLIKAGRKSLDDNSLPQLPAGWCWVTWENVLLDDKGAFRRGPFGSALKKSIFVESGYKVYEQYCAINDDCSFARYYITPEKFNELKSFEVKAGDYLISCSGVTLGRITRVPENSENGIINQALLRVRINDKVIDHKYFINYFRSQFFQTKLFDSSTGTAIPNVKGVKELKALPIPIAPIAEQKRIVAEVERRLSVIQDLEQIIDSNLKRTERLHQSILKQAFEGRLRKLHG